MLKRIMKKYSNFLKWLFKTIEKICLMMIMKIIQENNKKNKRFNQKNNQKRRNYIFSNKKNLENN